MASSDEGQGSGDCDDAYRAAGEFFSLTDDQPMLLLGPPVASGTETDTQTGAETETGAEIQTGIETGAETGASSGAVGSKLPSSTSVTTSLVVLSLLGSRCLFAFGSTPAPLLEAAPVSVSVPVSMPV